MGSVLRKGEVPWLEKKHFLKAKGLRAVGSLEKQTRRVSCRPYASIDHEQEARDVRARPKCPSPTGASGKSEILSRPSRHYAGLWWSLVVFGGL
jgi:hypothetical protein